MNQPSIELARQGLDVYAGEMSPHYEQVRELLAGELSKPARTLEALKYEAEHAYANAALVRDTIDLLPHTDEVGSGYTQVFSVEDVYTAQALQSSVLWYNLTHYGRARPFFIVGRAQQSESKTDLLLQPPTATGLDNRVQSVTVKTKDLPSIDQRLAERLHSSYTDDEITELFDKKSGSLIVDSKNSTSTSVGFLGGNVLSRMYSGVSSIKSDFAMPYVDGISNAEFARFDVAHHLNRLTTIFGVTDLFAKLLESYESKLPTDPYDQLIDEKDPVALEIEAATERS
jgi:hypothetical protein